MTDVKSEKKVKDPLSEAKNWEDRVRKEMQAPHKWSEDWGTLFHGEVPHEYDDRVKHLEEVLKTKPQGQILPRYGLGMYHSNPHL
jgi:hypothetical protein